MSDKGCGGTNDALKDHLTKCCGYGTRPDPIGPCPAGQSSSVANPCLGGSPPPECCPAPPSPCPVKLEIKCEVPPTATFSCPESPPPPEACVPKKVETVKKC